MRTITLVFGPSGVGKTTLINEFVRKNPAYAMASAGSLIDSKLAERDRDRLRLRESAEILRDQLTLIKNFREFALLHKNENILFDGHCVIDNGIELIEVPFDVIRKLSPTGILFIQDAPENIIYRRLQDIHRPFRSIQNVEEVALYAKKSKEVAERYAKALNIPFLIASGTIEEFESALNRLYSQ